MSGHYHGDADVMLDAARLGGSTPSYFFNLSLIGQYLNQQHARFVTIAEVDTGFLLLYYPNGDIKKPKTLAIHYTDLLELSGPFSSAAVRGKGALVRGGDLRDKKHPICPQGYDTVLRAIGYKLDRRTASSLTICETNEKLYVNFWVDKATFIIRNQRRQAISTEQFETYTPSTLVRLVESIGETRSRETSRYAHGLKANHHDYNSTMAAAFIVEDEGDYREAENLFSRVVSHVAEHPDAHYHIARLALARGDKRAASNAIAHALRFRSDAAPVHDLHGRVLLQSKQLKEAVAAFQAALEIEPDNAIMHYHLGKTYEVLGQKEEAAAELAMSASQFAAPAWDDEEDSESTILPEEPLAVAPVELVAHHNVVGAAALLPPSNDGSFISTTLAPPSLTTDFSVSVSTNWSSLPPQPLTSVTEMSPAAPVYATTPAAQGSDPWSSVPSSPSAMPSYDPAASWPTATPSLPVQPFAPPMIQPTLAAPPEQFYAPNPAPLSPQGYVSAPVPQAPHYPPSAMPPPIQEYAPVAMSQAPHYPPTPGPTPMYQVPPAPPQEQQFYPLSSSASQPYSMPPPQQAQSYAVPSITQPMASYAPSAPPSVFPPVAPEPASAAPSLEQRIKAATSQNLTGAIPVVTPPAAGTYPTEAPFLSSPNINSISSMDPAAWQTTAELPISSFTPADQGLNGLASPVSPGFPASQQLAPTVISPPSVVEDTAPASPPGGAVNTVELAAEIMVIQRALESEPNRADLHRKLGFLLARQGRTAEAATEFRKALQCSRTNL